MEKNKFKSYIDNRGWLTPIEFKNLSFIPKRIFLVSKVPIYMERGGHAHRQTKQLLICIKGQIEVILHNGITEEKIILEKNESILIPEMIWDSQKFLTNNAELMVICSTEYDVKDYIFDFNEFIELKN